MENSNQTQEFVFYLEKTVAKTAGYTSKVKIWVGKVPRFMTHSLWSIDFISAKIVIFLLTIDYINGHL